MISNDNSPKSNLSDELTVVFLRGNGSPRTFRLPVATLQRALTALGFLFCFALLAALFFLALNFVRPSPEGSPVPVSLPVAAVPAPPAPATAATEEAKPGIWQKISGDSVTGNDSELKKEVEGLHQDIARLSAQIDGRKELATGPSAALLQLFGPRSTLAPESNTMIRIKNPRVQHEAGKDVVLNFELHNVDPNQKQERGYIVALAKTADLLMVYPPNAFNPSQNIVLDFTKGETFGVSRFRAAQATFSSAALNGKKAHFQILLFSTDGRVIGSQHVEEK